LVGKKKNDVKVTNTGSHSKQESCGKNCVIVFTLRRRS